MDGVLSSFYFPLLRKNAGVHIETVTTEEREKSRFNIGQSTRINEMISKRYDYKK
jgi:hypothetical protein